ncbi:hypothetical protein G6F31_021359 [Rhizopus arrhizus]|nr:hypothetical protein G6F31_021359 [Rhizopus arrhizus]
MPRRCACARAPASSPLASRYSSDSGNSLASTGTSSKGRAPTAMTERQPQWLSSAIATAAAHRMPSE